MPIPPGGKFFPRRELTLISIPEIVEPFKRREKEKLINFDFLDELDSPTDDMGERRQGGKVATLRAAYENQSTRSLQPSSFAPPVARLSSLPSSVQLAAHVQCGGTAEEYFDEYDKNVETQPEVYNDVKDNYLKNPNRQCAIYSKFEEKHFALANSEFPSS